MIEDYLEPLGLSFDEFRDEMTGGWMFNYVSALRLAGVRAVLVCISRSVAEAKSVTHLPTGTTMVVLPPTPLYRALRERTVGWKADAAPAVQVTPRLAWLAPLASYIATPLRSLARELRRERCDALLCQDYEYPRFDVSVLLGRALALPVFATFQGGRGDGLDRPLRRAAIRASAGLIVGPREERERVMDRYAVPPSKIAPIFNPVDLSSWEPAPQREARRALDLPDEARVVAWHGRVKVEDKGVDVLLDAWETVRRGGGDREDRRLLLVGTGDDADLVRRRIVERGLEGVRWINRHVLDRRTLCRYLSAADVYAFPSKREGFPVAPIEAMACALPVVAADASGVPDILEGGSRSGGIVVPRGDAAALAAELDRLLSDPHGARAMGKRARRRAELGFSLESVGPALHDFLFR